MKCEIKVLTYRLDMLASPMSVAICLESEKIIDHADSSDRKWLGTHCYWAMRNGRKVVTYPIN